jgi:hypothetical protein
MLLRLKYLDFVAQISFFQSSITLFQNQASEFTNFSLSIDLQIHAINYQHHIHIQPKMTCNFFSGAVFGAFAVTQVQFRYQQMSIPPKLATPTITMPPTSSSTTCSTNSQIGPQIFFIMLLLLTLIAFAPILCNRVLCTLRADIAEYRLIVDVLEKIIESLQWKFKCKSTAATLLDMAYDGKHNDCEDLTVMYKRKKANHELLIMAVEELGYGEEVKALMRSWGEMVVVSGDEGSAGEGSEEEEGEESEREE